MSLPRQPGQPRQVHIEKGRIGRKSLETSIQQGHSTRQPPSPPKVVRKILDLEFVEMAELKTDIWMDDQPPTDVAQPARRPTGRPLITDIRIWLECYSRLASVLCTRFPEKAAELWAYQATITRAAHNYEGANWVAYDRQYRREMLAKKDLNWSQPNTRLYNEAFTGRAKNIPRCPHCLGEDHAAPSCPHNPNPPMVGWIPDPRQFSALQGQPKTLTSSREVCRNYNENRCRFARCRYLHTCQLCSGPHPMMLCPRNTAENSGGPVVRNRTSGRGRHVGVHPYPPRS